MKALKYQVRIGRDHRVVLDVPAETPEGMAEVIVLVSENPAHPDDFGAFLAELRRTSPQRTKEDIDREVAEERASWGDE